MAPVPKAKKKSKPAKKKTIYKVPPAANINLKKPASSWVEGFELREQFPSSGDYKYIESKMHHTMSTGQHYSGYEILQIFKVLNSATYNRYRARRQQINFEIASAVANGESGAYVEEMHLWHGSPSAEKICEEGFKLGTQGGLFGNGVYFAEHSSKSNNYTWRAGGLCPAHRSHLCLECTRMMLLCKVALGRQMLTPRFVNSVPAGVDTIVAKPGVVNASLIYPEYVVYHKDQAYPSYLIKYKLKPLASRSWISNILS